MSYPSYFLIFVVILILVAQQEQQRRRANRLAARVHKLLDSVKNKPLDFFDSHTGRKLLSFNSILDRTEKKILFLERRKGLTGIHFSRRFWPLNQRIQELEMRATKLEGKSTIGSAEL